ncbi:MAG: cytochrome P450 [Bradyrhizobium sp.]|nr:cytochrome P450 [Bradyrhizobium sp.]
MQAQRGSMNARSPLSVVLHPGEDALDVAWRRAIRDFSFMGFAIPASTMVGVNPLFTFMPEIWAEPDRFDPMRFPEEAQRARHRVAFVPFGGAHMWVCTFAYMQAKCFAAALPAESLRFASPGYNWQMWPIPKPRAWRGTKAGVMRCVVRVRSKG